MHNKTDFASNVNGNIPYAAASNTDDVVKSLKKDSTKLLKCFVDKQMKDVFFVQMVRTKKL